VFHDAAAEFQQAGAALPGLGQAAAAGRIDRLRYAVIETRVPAALPGAQDQRRELIVFGHLVTEETLASKGQPLLASVPEFGKTRHLQNLLRGLFASLI
jgi:hypothetical protein